MLLRTILGAMILSMTACPPPEGGDTAGATDASTTDASTTGSSTEAITEGSTTEATSAGSTAATTSASSTTATTDDPTAGAQCDLPPLPQEVVESLGFDVLDSTFDMQPGESRSLALGAIECCYDKSPIEACVEYSVSPREGAVLDPATGEFTVLPDAMPGTKYTVTADVEAGRSLLMAEVYVYTPASDPLVGTWHEVAQLQCGSGLEVEPESPIGALRLRANGEMRVTWMPFEIYADYWGDYLSDPETGELALMPTGGNYVPADIDGVGTFKRVGDDLILEDMWLGSPEDPMPSVNCGHRFQR